MAPAMPSPLRPGRSPEAVGLERVDRPLAVPLASAAFSLAAALAAFSWAALASSANFAASAALARAPAVDRFGRPPSELCDGWRKWLMR